MKKEIINHLLFYFSYFIFIFLVNKLFSFSYWPLYVGGLVGMFMSYTDHLLHVFVFKPFELTSQRVNVLIKNKQYKATLMLLHDTCEERKDLIFHTVQFQIVFAILTFWVVSSSGNLFGRGLVLGYYLSLVIFNLKKYLNKELIFGDTDQTRIYFAVQVVLLFVFGLLI
jgi:hypothetical protein